MVQPADPALAPRIWQVGALCRAVADALDVRFNPVAVRGEISGFSRASSGHSYFCLKDAHGQLRCAMFKRTAQLMDFAPRDGDMVEARGRLGVYEPRGDLQLIVESLSRAGQGTLFERFLQLRAKLEAEGLFDPSRKRPLASMPRAIGLVTSSGAAALHDVVTALRRRAPHVPVVFAPAQVQGQAAAGDVIRALESLYTAAHAHSLDAILLVRGGGSIEDLWSFNDEALARAIVRSPVPIVCGVGHETDFTIADFCADVRAPTPTAAAELVARPLDSCMDELDAACQRLRQAVRLRQERDAQRLDRAASRLGRPAARVGGQHVKLSSLAHRLRFGVTARIDAQASVVEATLGRLSRAVHTRLDRSREQLDRTGLRLQLLDPRLVLERGYAWLSDEAGHAVTKAAQARAGQALTATLADGEVDLTVTPRRGNPS